LTKGDVGREDCFARTLAAGPSDASADIRPRHATSYIFILAILIQDIFPALSAGRVRSGGRGGAGGGVELCQEFLGGFAPPPPPKTVSSPAVYDKNIRAVRAHLWRWQDNNGTYIIAAGARRRRCWNRSPPAKRFVRENHEKKNTNYR